MRGLQAIERYKAETLKHERELAREQGLLTDGSATEVMEVEAVAPQPPQPRAGAAPTFAPQVRLDESGAMVLDETTLTVTAQQSEVDTYR